MPGPGIGGVPHIGFETYRLEDRPPPSSPLINRSDPWTLSTTKGGETFAVRDPRKNAPRHLQVGDRIKVVGRWVIENGHPANMRTRGWNSVGSVYIEFHPFDWTNMTLVVPPEPSGVEEEMLTLAAPLYEDLYVDKNFPNWLQGINGHIFVHETGRNFHNRTRADMAIKAPPLPAGFTAHPSLVDWRESIIRNGTGKPPQTVRTVLPQADGIRVTATVVAPAYRIVGGRGPNVAIANIDDPALGRSVFQARYRVSWKPRLVCLNDWVPLDRPAGATYKNMLMLRNRGPDPLELTKVSVLPGPQASAFAVTAKLPLAVPAGGSVDVGYTFSPGGQGHYSARLELTSNDPGRPTFHVDLAGMAGPPTPTSRVEVAPKTLDFGHVPVGSSQVKLVTVSNSGTAPSKPVYIPDPYQALPGSPPGQFWAGGLTSSALAPGEVDHVLVTFSPTQTGAARATVRIQEGDSAGLTERPVEVHGRGTAPELVSSPASLDFGFGPPLDQASLDVEVRNVGDAPLVISSIILPALPYEFDLVNPPAVPLAIPPGAAETLTVTATFPLPGQANVRTLGIASNDPANPNLAVRLLAQSEGPRLWGPDIVLCEGLPGTPELEMAVEVGNRGSSSLTVTALSVRLGAQSPFEITGPAAPFEVGPGDSMPVLVRCRMRRRGKYSDNLVIESDGHPSPASVGLRAEVL